MHSDTMILEGLDRKFKIQDSEPSVFFINTGSIPTSSSFILCPKRDASSPGSSSSFQGFAVLSKLDLTEPDFVVSSRSHPIAANKKTPHGSLYHSPL